MEMISISAQDKGILRELGKKYREIAELPVQKETITLWKAINSLKPVRPMVMIDQLPWHDLNAEGELTLKTSDPFCRNIETKLRRELYKWKHFRTDMVIEPVLRSSPVVEGWDFGIKVKETEKAVTDVNNDVVGHFYNDQIKEEEDIQKIKNPAIRLNKEKTEKDFETMQEIFTGVIEVKKEGIMYGFPVWDVIVMLRGAGELLLDMALRPEFMHKIISRFSEAYLAGLDQLETQGLLGYGFRTIHCSGAHTNELPSFLEKFIGTGFDPAKPRAKDTWTFGMAQIFSTASPAMHDEFEIEYAKKWYERFGLVYYGCCEPLDKKIGVIRKLPNVRKISISPWADVKNATEQIGKDYVISRKSSPAFFSRGNFELDAIIKDTKDVITDCKKNGTPVEFILKDLSTVNYEPKRLTEWADTVMKIVKK